MSRKGYHYYYFIFAKIVGLAVKPLFLYYFIHSNMQDEASTVALIFLFLAGVFVILSVPVHFEFYKKYFEDNLSMVSSRKAFSSYVNALFSHVLLVSPIILIISLASFDSVILSFLIFFLLLSEKVFDEIQRFLIFSKKFVGWSNAFLLKSLVPIVLAIGTSILFDFEIIKSFIVYTIVLNIAVGVVFIPKFLYSLIKGYRMAVRFNLVDYVGTFRAKLLSKFLSGVTHANVLNADKWLVTILSLKSLLSELVLVAQFSNGISIASNYAFIANRRSELLNKDNSLITLWHGFRVPGVTLIFGLVLGVSFAVAGYLGLLELNSLPVLSVMFVVAAYTVYAITEPVTEYIFWNGGVKKLVQIDLIFFVLVALFGLTMFFGGVIEYISIAFFVSMSLRLLIQLFLLKSMGRL